MRSSGLVTLAATTVAATMAMPMGTQHRRRFGVGNNPLMGNRKFSTGAGGIMEMYGPRSRMGDIQGAEYGTGAQSAFGTGAQSAFGTGAHGMPHHGGHAAHGANGAPQPGAQHHGVTFEQAERFIKLFEHLTSSMPEAQTNQTLQFNAGTVSIATAGDQANVTLTAYVQKPMIGKRLWLQANTITAWQLIDFKVGTESQFAGSGQGVGVPATRYAYNAVGAIGQYKEAGVGTFITLLLVATAPANTFVDTISAALDGPAKDVMYHR